METTTLMILMAAALVILVALVGILMLRLFHMEDELKEKNSVIVREIRRNQELIDRATRHGVKRAAMLLSIIVTILICMGTSNIPQTNNFLYQYIKINLRSNDNLRSATNQQKHYTQNFDDLLIPTKSSELGSASVL